MYALIQYRLSRLHTSIRLALFADLKLDHLSDLPCGMPAQPGRSVADNSTSQRSVRPYPNVGSALIDLLGRRSRAKASPCATDNEVRTGCFKSMTRTPTYIVSAHVNPLYRISISTKKNTELYSYEEPCSKISSINVPGNYVSIVPPLDT